MISFHRFQHLVLIGSLVLCFSMVSFHSAKAQTDDERIAQLYQQIADLEKEAAQYRGNIASEQAMATSLKKEITILKNQISNIQTQIAITNKKIDKTKIEITGIEGNIFDTLKGISQKKQTIGRLILSLNQQDSEDMVTLLLKHASISDFFQETQQANTVNSELLDVIGNLQKQKQDLEQNKNNLEGKKTELVQLNEENSNKKESLSGVVSTKDNLLAKTKGQEAQYQKILSSVETKEATFFDELRILESKTVAGGLFIVHVTSSNPPPRGTKIFTWPEVGYKVTQGYGMTTYAKRGAYGGAPHNGIDISGGYGSEILSIGDGELLARGTNNGFGNWIAVKHDYDLVSIYGHLSSYALIPIGTKVKGGQVIGYEGSTGNSTGSHVHLSLYKDFFTYTKNSQLYFNYFEGSLNPADYLK